MSWIEKPGNLEYLSLTRFEDKYDDKFSIEKVKKVLSAYVDSLQKPVHLKQFEISLRLPNDTIVDISAKGNICTLSLSEGGPLKEQDSAFMRANVLPEGFCF